MQWMEVVKLRIAEKDPESVEQEIVKLIKELGDKGNMKDTKLYHDAVVDNDLMVHLYWETDNGATGQRHRSLPGSCPQRVRSDFSFCLGGGDIGTYWRQR